MQINENIASVVRSVVIGGVALSFLGPIGGLTESWKNISNVQLATAQREAKVTALDVATDTLRSQLAMPCINWVFSDKDTKVETRAEDAINEVFEGDVDYRSVCQFVLD